jgi:hypothetical protein
VKKLGLIAASAGVLLMSVSCAEELEGPQPSVTSLAPNLACGEQLVTTITLSGEELSPLALDAAKDDPLVAVPDISLELVSDLTGASASGEVVTLPNDPEDPAAARIRWLSSTTMELEIYEELNLAAGVYDVTVSNANGKTATLSAGLTITEAPTITSVVPSAVCELDQPETLEITGTSFLKVGDDFPTVTASDGASTTALTVVAGLGCTALAGTSPASEVCTGLTVAVPVGGFAAASYSITLTNPAPAACETSEPATFEVVPNPIVTDVDPTLVCTNGDTFTVTGENFIATSEILLDGTAVVTTVDSDTQLTGEVPTLLASGLYDVSVTSGQCSSNVLVDALQVVEAPVVFYVDPPFNYNAVNIRVTVWVSGINGVSPTVSIRDTTTPGAVPIELTNPIYDGKNRILATIPSGTAVGDYDVIVDDDPCPAEIINALHLRDDTSVHIESIEQSFGTEGLTSGVTIRSLETPPVGTINFEATPRAYLSPVGGLGEAVELRATAFVDTATLTATVPSTLADGVYDLIVVNPDGTIGLLEGAFTVLDAADPPPTISALNPRLVVDQVDQAVDIIGMNFPDINNVTVSGVCKDPSDSLAPLENPTVAVLTSAPALIETEWNMSNLQGYVCVVTVANNANGSFDTFSALSVTNNSGNINSFVPTLQDMRELRRALGAAALRLNNQARFIFAVGGDDGAGTTHQTVEAAPVDPFGAMGAWEYQANQLPEARNYMATTTIGRYVYMAGGRLDDGTVSNSFLRSYLLDPEEVAELADISLERGDGNGLDGGVYYYRVAAVLDSTDANNPDGESLPSEPIIIQAPALTEKVLLTLFWDPVPNAAAYRIYRSPTPVGSTLGGERLLVEVAHSGAADTTQSFVDDGSIDNTLETKVPLALGSLGVWHEIPDGDGGFMALNEAREGAAMTAVPSPVDPDTYYIYVAGGLSEPDPDNGNAQTPLTSIEFIEVSADAPNVQLLDQVNDIQLSAQVLDTGRWLVGATYIDDTRSTVANGLAWLYVVKGEDEAGGTVNEVTVFEVDTDNGGELTNKNDGGNSGAFGGGYGLLADNNTMFVIGGGGSPDATIRTGNFQDNAVNCAPNCYPVLQNLNAGPVLDTARYLHGTAVEGAFVYALGGQTLLLDATRSTEQTNL